MNAHQRRCASRRRHMDLPLGKQVRVEALLGRTVYAYGSLSCDITIHGRYFDVLGTAVVHRHVRPDTGGPIDLLLATSTFDAIAQVQAAYPLHRGGSAKPA